MCTLDDYMISVGKKVNSFSGFFDGAINLVFRAFTDDHTAFNTAVAANNLPNIG